MEIPNEKVIGNVASLRREIEETRNKRVELEKREKELYSQLFAAQKGCTHKNADGTSAVKYVGPGYDGCCICGEWF